jgi:Protein of unknown function (DUF2849)
LLALFGPYIEDCSFGAEKPWCGFHSGAIADEATMTSPLDQKIRISGPVMVTANRVGDGAVVYRRADGGWSTDLAAAAVTADVAVARDLLKDAVADDLRAVGSYIAPVKLSPDGRVRPGNLRETIRLRGPTIALPVPVSVPSLALQN